MKLVHPRDWPVSSKVFLAPLMALVALIAIGATSWWSSQQLTSALNHLGEVELSELLETHALAQDVNDFHRSVYQSMVWEAIGQRADRLAALDAELTAAAGKLTERLDRLTSAQGLPPERRALLGSIAKKLTTYRKVAVDTLDMKSAGVASAATYVPALDVEYKELTAMVRELVRQQVTSTREDTVLATTRAQASTRISTLSIVLVIAVCAVLAWRAGVMITRPLEEASRLAKAMSEGDLTRRGRHLAADSTGQLVLAINHVASQMEGVVTEIRSTSQDIQRESDSLSSGNELLSRRTDTTASSVRSAAHAIEQLAEGIQHNADQSQAAATKAKQSSETAQRGGNLVHEVMKAMAAINAQAQRIGDIIKTIDGIAFQTNILALNAAVEAARAGEQGRGFAVVAAEVRQLAQRSATAAKEIRSLISAAIDGIGQGADQANKAGESMEEIVTAIMHVATAIEAVAGAASEQALCISEISKSVQEVDTATRQNAQLVSEVSDSTRSLASQSDRLANLLTHFTVHSA